MAGAFPDSTFDAVGACTRALAGARDADSGLEDAETGSLGGLRAAGDRLALRRRFHNPLLHLEHQPSTGSGSDAYAALEAARLDALGARWLRGIAANLVAHPGQAEAPLRWLAFEIFSGVSGPAPRAASVGRLRKTLPSPLLDSLTVLASHLEDQAQFSPAAAAWVTAAARYLPRPDPDARAQHALPRRPRPSRKLPSRGDPGGVAAALRQRSDDERSGDGEGHASGADMGLSRQVEIAYRAYTTACDRVIQAAALATRDELLELEARLDTELGAIKPLVARLAKRLMRVLLARQTRTWDFDLEEGIVDSGRLAPFIASPASIRPFRQERESRFPSTVVSLLIDHSGSMRGRPMLIAALTVEIFARVLERCGVRCEVLGFTTRDWDGGEPARAWAANGYPPDPGRLNGLEHIVIKSADTPWRRARVALGLFLRDEILKENIDGEAVQWAHGRLLTRAEHRRILVVVSDGTPMDEATMAANGHEYLERHLLSVVQQIESRSPVEIAAIGIGHDVSTFYRNATTVAKMEQLGPALTNKLLALLGA